MEHDFFSVDRRVFRSDKRQEGIETQDVDRSLVICTYTFENDSPAFVIQKKVENKRFNPAKFEKNMETLTAILSGSFRSLNKPSQ